jgi:glutamate--cysteine ligase
VDSGKPVPYHGERSIKAILEALKKEFDWAPIMEGKNIIGLKKDGQSVTLEPGGQLELSGAMVKTLHQTCAESTSHLRQAQAVSEKLGINYIGMGFNANTKREDVPIMPKGRYNIMRDYMPKKGNLGLDMMLRTCTIQVSCLVGAPTTRNSHFCRKSIYRRKTKRFPKLSLTYLD